MRALIVTLSLAIIVAALVGSLVVFGGVRVSGTLLATIGAGLFMVAVLFAAISAIGPKFKPTPALTPIMAGASAAVFVAALVLAANAHRTGGRVTAFHAREPARVAPQSPAPTPEPQRAESEALPDIPEPTPDAFAAIPPVEEGGDISTDEAPEPPATDEVTVVPPRSTVIPIPPVRPRSPSETPQTIGPEDMVTLSTPSFDSSSGAETPTAPHRTAGITPPLPRSRPCGADGPPCP